MEDVRVNLLTPKKTIIQIAPPFIEVSVNLCSLFSMWKLKYFINVDVLSLSLSLRSKLRIVRKPEENSGEEKLN